MNPWPMNQPPRQGPRDYDGGQKESALMSNAAACANLLRPGAPARQAGHATFLLSQRGVSSLGSDSRTAGSGVEHWILAASILGSSMAFIDGTVVNVALPVLQKALGASAAQVQWVVESYAVALAALLLLGGALADKVGRRRIFAAGVALFALASAGCALSPSINWLIAARAVQGLGGALLVPTSLALLGAGFPAERRGQAIGKWSAFSAATAGVVRSWAAG